MLHDAEKKCERPLPFCIHISFRDLDDFAQTIYRESELLVAAGRDEGFGRLNILSSLKISYCCEIENGQHAALDTNNPEHRLGGLGQRRRFSPVYDGRNVIPEDTKLKCARSHELKPADDRLGVYFVGEPSLIRVSVVVHADRVTRFNATILS
jgi:hypothetical protein